MLSALTIQNVQRSINLAEKLNAVNLRKPQVHGTTDFTREDVHDAFNGDASDEELALLGYLSQRSNDELNEMTALSWLGRGIDGNSAEDWVYYLKEASTGDDSNRIEYLLWNLYLADELRTGLDILSSVKSNASRLSSTLFKRDGRPEASLSIRK